MAEPGKIAAYPPPLGGDGLPAISGLPTITTFDFVRQLVQSSDNDNQGTVAYWKFTPSQDGLIRLDILQSISADPSREVSFWVQTWGAEDDLWFGDGGHDYSIIVKQGKPVVIGAHVQAEGDSPPVGILILRVSDYAGTHVVQPAQTVTKVLAGSEYQIARDYVPRSDRLSPYSRGAKIANSYLAQPSSAIIQDELECVWRNDGNRGNDFYFHTLYSPGVDAGMVAAPWGDAGPGSDDPDWRVKDGTAADFVGPYGGLGAPPADDTYVQDTIRPLGPPPYLPEQFDYLGHQYGTYHWYLHTWPSAKEWEVEGGGASGWNVLEWIHVIFSDADPPVAGLNGFIARFPWNLIASAKVPAGHSDIQGILLDLYSQGVFEPTEPWDYRVGEPIDLQRLWVSFDHDVPEATDWWYGSYNGPVYSNLTFPATNTGTLEVSIAVREQIFPNDLPDVTGETTPAGLEAVTPLGTMDISGPPPWFEIPASMVAELTPGFDAESWPGLVTQTKPADFATTSDFAVAAGEVWTPAVKMQMKISAFMAYDTYMPELPEVPGEAIAGAFDISRARFS